MAKSRSDRGNMLILITAFVVIFLALAFFALGYVRLVGSSSEQKTAIESAAIAAAREISTIVVDNPDFGYVGLSDSAPIGSATSAGDFYYLPVHSINTLIGTARLDYLIGSQPGLDVPEWRELATIDLNKAKAAADELIAEIKDAIKPTGSAHNKNGVVVKPYQAAEAAYLQNLIRMTGGGNYVPNSLKLELGVVDGITSIAVPNPVGVDSSLDNTNTTAGCYKSYVNVPIGDQDFVFAGIGSSIKLVDLKQWKTSKAGLPYQHPTIIRAEALQVVKNATTGDATLKSVACAQPASVYDPRPYPGALTLSFPDGVPDGTEAITQPIDLYGPLLSQSEDTCEYLDATPGDYPTTGGSAMSPGATWPIPSESTKLASSACKIAVYDWLRRAGTKANVDSMVGMHHTPFLPQGSDVPWPPSHPVGTIPRGVAHIYKFDTDGVIDYEAKEMKPYPWWVVSDKQNMIECFDALTNGSNSRTVQPVALTIIPPIGIPLASVELTPRYDMFVRIYSRRYGNAGGKHEGEPMDNNLVSHARPKLRLDAFRNFGRGSLCQRLAGRGAKTKADGPLIGIGVGAIPTLMPQEDFAFKWQLISLLGPQIDRDNAKYEKFDGTGPGMRPTYSTNGSVADIRFRRVVIARDPVSGVINVLGSTLPLQKQQGYIGEK
ncbi:hypothetical protein KF707_16830 [Candidatus Obscuribacterales bacterium]|nr:hypothetical protein [Candidatus Obscuribacterales bacterium]MBX3137893.1 hypothetical protein [Candidatus Obscuribacterales bacterium]MBX3153196.1 hypothetical protein [Candidatus Obscuribacterales bacterium]